MDAIGVDEIPVGLACLDASDRVVEANAEFVRWAGVTPVLGRHISDLLEPADDFLHIEGALSRLMVNPSDRARAALVVRTENSRGPLITLLDATDRYEEGHRLRDSRRLADRTRNRLELIIEASIAFSTADNETRLSEILADVAKRSYGASESGVFLFDDSRVLRPVAGTNPFSAVDLEATLPMAVAGFHDILKISDPEEAARLSSRAAELMRQAGIQAVLAAPLRLNATMAGFFACFFRYPRRFDDEASPLAEALAGQAAQALSSVRLRQRLEQAALHDETTGLPNRRFLDQRGPVHSGSGISVIFIDLDGFKGINDAHGHQLGDEVLREVGRRLASTVREGDVVARYGGDEFVAVCSVSESTALEIAQRMVAAVAQPISFLPDYQPTASVGVASLGDGENPARIDRLIRLADYAMYLAKGTGGNRVVPASMLDRATISAPLGH